MKITVLLFIVFIAGSCTSVDSLIKDKEIDKALDYCKEQKIPDEMKICYEKVADSYFKDANFIKAEKYYDSQFADNIAKKRESSFQIAELLLKKKDYDSALKYYDKTKKRDEGYLKVADTIFHKKDYTKALELYYILGNNDGVKKIADIYYKNGEYLRAFKLYKKLGVGFKYAFNIASKLLKLKDFIAAANLYKVVSNGIMFKESYKKFGFYLIEKSDFETILSVSSPIVSILRTDDYLFAINQKGEIYQSYLYMDKFEKVFSLSSKKERVISAEYISKHNQIIVLTNAGLVFYDIVNKEIIRRLNKKITAFTVNKDESFLITANEKIISVREFSSLDELLFFKGHTARVNKIAVFKNKVISAGEDKLIRVWDIETGNEIFVLRGHFLAITSIDLDVTNTFLASGSKDKTVKIWDLNQKKLVNNFKLKSAVNSVVFSNDSSKLIVSINARMYNIIDILEKKVSDSLLFHSSNINTAIIDRNDNFIYSGSKDGKLFTSLPNAFSSVENAFLRSSLNKKDYWDIAEIYFKKQKYEEALKYYQSSDKSEEGILKIGDTYYKNENYNEALKYYTLLSNEKYMQKVADTYFKIGDYNNAGEYYIRAKDYLGILKTAKMFLYEKNYYDSIRLYIILTKQYDKESEISKINAVYITIANIFMNMEEVTYHNTDDEVFKKKINEKLKNWYEFRFDIAQEYYDKANMTQEGYLKLGSFLCNNNLFDLGILSYEKLENKKDSKKMVKKCLKEAGSYNFEKAGVAYKNLVQLAKDEGDWDLITKNFNDSLKFIKESKKYYKRLRDYKKVRKIQKIERGLRRYKKRLGL